MACDVAEDPCAVLADCVSADVRCADVVFDESDDESQAFRLAEVTLLRNATGTQPSHISTRWAFPAIL